MVDPNQELVALGAANLAAGLFHGFPISSSASRTLVAVSAGARSQLTPLVGATAIVVPLLVAPGAPEPPPTHPGRRGDHRRHRAGRRALVGRLYRVRRLEFVLWLAAFAGVALLGVLVGILVAIALSLGDFVRRAWRPYDAVLGREDELKGYHDLERRSNARQPWLLLYHDAPLFFANATTSGAASATWSPRPHPHPLGGGGGRAHHRRGHHRRRHPSGVAR